MKHLSLFIILLFSVWLFSSCKDSGLVSPSYSTWTQGEGLQGFSVSGFGHSGNNLLAGASLFPLPYAYIFLSADNGLTWKLDTAFHVDNTIPLTHLIFTPNMSFIDDGTVLLAGVSDLPRGAIYRSTDNGMTWSDSRIAWPENDSDLTEDMNCFCVTGGNVFAGTGHGVFVSTDHGTTWTYVNTGMPNRVGVDGIISTGSNIFASTTGEGIFRSTDNGASWSEVNTTDFDFNSLALIGKDIFVGAFNQFGKPSTGGIFVTTDNGNSWHHQDSELTNHGVNVVYASGSYIFAGTDTSIFASNDGGATWRNISIGTPVAGAAGGATALVICGSYLFANSGGGAWRYPL